MKTVLQTNSATVVFTPGIGGIGKLNFSNYAALNNFTINRLMAVVNQTRNTLIYAEAQSEFGITNWNPVTKELTLASDTSTHANTDIIQIIYDTPAMPVIPAEEYFDPVNKQRTSTSQALIDTDFEYGAQSTKWETCFLTNNRPSAFYEPSTPFNSALITNISTQINQRTVTVNCTSTAGTGIAVGQPIFVQDTFNYRTNGWFVIDSITATSFTFNVMENFDFTGNVFDPTRTQIYPGGFYTQAGIPIAASNGFNYSTFSPAITCTTFTAHGLSPGDAVFVVNTTVGAGVAPNGSWTVTSTPTVTQFTFDPITKPVAAVNYSPPTGVGAAAINLYPRPVGFSIHRAFDGGVLITTGGGAPNTQIVRQTRKYFRYQSGKGIQFSTGSVLKPTFQVETLSAASLTLGATISATCKVPHGMQPGSYLNVEDTGDTAYNGRDIEVTAVPNPLTLTYTARGTPSSLNISSLNLKIQPGSIWTSIVRLGMFDQQNGMFFEYDGNYVWAVRRNSTTQIAGTVNATLSSNVITGNGTRFTQQLAPNDYIVIKGQSYKVFSIVNNELMYILPEYKGPSYNNLVCSKTIDLRVRQDQWNIDPLDGTGPSGYVLNPTRMQMFYMDYSWYGAGFIRFGVRGTGGNVIYCHKMANNNVNTEAYLRSGNLPARYEEVAVGPTTLLTTTLNAAGTTMGVQDTTFFPNSGIVKVTAAGNSINSPIEIIRYNNKTSNTLTNLRRGIFGGAGPTTFTYNANAPIPVELIGTVGPTVSAIIPSVQSISHWGSSVMMDGRFDDDSQFVFSAGPSVSARIGGSQENIIIAIRLAPSVDNGRVGLIGIREVVNRMQIKLRSMDIISSGNFRINLYLNSRTTGNSISFTNVGGSSLAQFVTPPASLGPPAVGTRIVGGESIYSFFCNPGTSTQSQYTYQDLSFVRELGNSILGGGNSLIAPTTSTLNMYPDGPDILYVTAANLENVPATILGRISWTESQA